MRGLCSRGQVEMLGLLVVTDDRKSVPALPSKKPAMPPPPIGKKPQPVKHAADLITQTDDHKAKESQKGTAVLSLQLA